MEASLIASTIKWIGSLLDQEGRMLLDVKDQVRGLKEDLELMQQFLQNADANADINDISTVINQIRKLAYDVEDIIDTYILKVEAKANVCGKKGCFLKYMCFLRTTPQAYCIGRKIQSRQGKVKRISDILIDSGVRRIAKAGEDLTSSSSRERYSKKKPRNYPYDDDDDGGDLIVGLDKDIKMLVEVLMGEGKTQVKFVSIVGMGGSGKTTLARKLYNHPFTKDCFDCFAWVYISETWSTRHILSEILRKVSSPTEVSNLNAESSMNELVDKLRSILEKKLYLVVLDDVWRKEVLVDILPALPRVSSNKGSKIIITTRNEEVVLQFQNLQRHLYVHKPMPLSKEESWELFCKITSNHHTNCNDKTYKDLGQEMLKKCDGLPLAIVALAGILNTKTNIYEWQQISKAVRSRVMEGTCTHQYGKVGEMLALSFDDLPCDLKPCFLYLGVFPEDCQIPAGMLIRMWIAEGFITANGAMSPEDVAMQYIEELSHRFMIQVVRTNMKGEIKAIHLHDLLRVLCIKKAQEQGFLQVKNLPSSDESPVAFQSRRASLHSSMSIPKQASKLRSLVILTRSSVTHSAYESKESFNFKIIHHKFKLLRLLNLWGIKTTTGGLPSEIGNLIHLRYLGIRASNVTEFPTSIGKLRNLLTLDYRNVDCSDKNVELPNVLCKLVLLRHLFLPDDCPWTREELKLSALRNLQILWGVKCGGGDWFSREMLELSTTISKLKVIVSTEKNLEAVFDSPSIFSNHLHTFHCEWSVGVALKHVNHAISQNQHIHKLVLVGKINVEKLSLILPPNLLILELKDSILENEDIMVVAGALAHLKLLRLSNSYMGTTFTCNFGSFLQLEELYLENLQNLAMWTIKKGAMSSLKKLEILNCQSLHFPQGLVFVTTLQQLEYFGVPKKFGEEARVHGWSQKRLRLPHNYEAIIEQCDDPVDMSSIHKLYEQLTAGIFLNNRTKKFWVVKREDSHYNCFMVYMTDLNLTMNIDCDGLPLWGSEYSRKLTETKDSDGALIKAMKIVSPTTPLHVVGRFSAEYLSPNVTYTFTYMFMFDDNSESEEKVSVRSLLRLPDRKFQEHRQELNSKPRKKWIKFPIGEFRTNKGYIGEIEFTLHFQCPTKEVKFAVKGVIIEPNLFNLLRS